MSATGNALSGSQALAVSTQMHRQYFEGLESRLLKESDKLTHLMGRCSNGTQTKTKLRSATSLSRSNPLTIRRSKRHEENRPGETETANITRARQLC